MHPLRRHVSVHRDKESALKHFHKEVIKKTETLIGHTFFEIICPAPPVLAVIDVENYASQWTDRGWSADVVSTGYNNGNRTLNMRLRSYVDVMPF